MAVVGTSETYTTITSWESAGSPDNLAECKDEAFDEAWTQNSGTNPRITADGGAEHDGSEGSGARIVWSVDRSTIDLQQAGVVLETMEVDGGDNDAGASAQIAISGSGGAIRRCLIHNFSRNQSIMGIDVTDDADILNCIIYAIDCTYSYGVCYGVDATQNYTDVNLINVTWADVTHTGSGGNGLRSGAYGTKTIKNCVAANTDGSAFTTIAGTHSTATNASDDSTAQSPIVAEPVVAADEFVSTATPDYRLKSGAECIDAGTDIGTTPTNVEIDINGRDRDSNGDTWDVGAHELVSAATSSLVFSPGKSFRAMMVR